MKKINAKKLLISISALILVTVLVLEIFVFTPRRRYACAYAKQISASSVADIDKITLISHRGIATEAPENTLPAYVLAAKKGFKYVETDIRATADGVWVLTHDNSLKRMTGFSGKCEQMTFAQVRSHPVIKGANAKNYKNLLIPSYEEYLGICVKYNLIPVIEIKTYPEEYENAPYRDILSLLKKYNINNAIIISFSASALSEIRKFDKNIKMLYLCKTLDDETLKTVKKLDNCVIDCSYKALRKSPDIAKKAVENGMELAVWTVDKKVQAEIAIGAGATYLTTNAIMPER